MTGHRMGCVAALTLALTAACGKDPASIAGQQSPTLAANGAATTSRLGNDDDEHGTGDHGPRR